MCVSSSGSCGNLGDPVLSADSQRPSRGGRKAMAPGSAAARRPPRKQRMSGAAAVPPTRRKRSVAGRSSGSLSVLVVPRKQGNRTRRDPVEGSGTPAAWDRLWAIRRRHRTPGPYTRNRTDSEARSAPRACPHRRARAKPSAEEPYALMRARTGLWEPGAGNRPGSPGQFPRNPRSPSLLQTPSRRKP